MFRRIPIDFSEELVFGVGPVIAEPNEQSKFEITLAIRRGRAALDAWKSQSIPERLTVIRNFRKQLAAQAREISHLLCGKRPPEEFLVSELIPSLDACRFLEKSAARLLRPRFVKGLGAPLWLRGVSHEIRREPLGLVLVIGASNYPFFLPAVQALQAIVAGNGVLLKPAPGGREGGRLMRSLLIECGLPCDILQLLPSMPEAATAALIEGVDKVFLTGSFQTGVKVMSTAALSATPAVVELSGCDAAFILPDADLDLAAQSIAIGLTLNSGHTCIAPRRAFVWHSVADAFKARLVAALRARPEILIEQPPLRQFAIQAVRCGAVLLNGSVDDDGVHGPLVVGNLPPKHDSAIAENWGPGLSIFEVASETEAVRECERSPFGLGASIFSRDIKGARDLAARLTVGSVCINDVIVPTADGRVPFAGRKRSGFGATRGPEGLLEMTSTKVVSIQSGPRWHLRPPLRNQFQVLCAYAEAAYGKRWRGMKALLSAFCSPERRSL